MSAVKNIGELKRAVARAISATHKTESEVINRALKNVAYKAMAETEFAEPAKIEANLRRDKIALKMAVIALKKKIGTPVLKKGQPFVYKRTGKTKVHGPLTRKEIGKYAKKIIGTRRGRSKAIRAGWIPAIVALGGEIRGGAHLKSGGTTSRGGARKATPKKTEGRIINTLETKDHTGKKTDVKAIRQAREGLARAEAIEAKAVENYARKKEYEAAIAKEIRIFIT